MTTKKPRSLDDYWSGIQGAVDVRLAALRTYLKHPASGTPIEGYFRDIIREYLPRRYVVEPGFVVNADGEMSDYLDAIIADLSEIPPLCSEPLLKIYPAEAVVAAIEITSAPQSEVTLAGGRKVSKLEADILKLHRLRQLGRKRIYLHTFSILTPQGDPKGVMFKTVDFPYDLAPRTCLITCGDEWKRRPTHQKHVEAALQSTKSFINAAFSMEHGMLWFKPYKGNLESEWRPENDARKKGLLEFIFFLNKLIASNLTFRIDIERYRPTLPPVAEEGTAKGPGS